MVRRLRWSEVAGRQFGDWTTYLADYDLVSAKSKQAAVQARVEKLPLHPFRYRESRWPGFRELSLPRWRKLVVYQIKRDEVLIIAFYDTRQNLSAMSPNPE